MCGSTYIKGSFEILTRILPLGGSVHFVILEASTAMWRTVK